MDVELIHETGDVLSPMSREQLFLEYMKNSHAAPIWVYVAVSVLCFIAIFNMPYGYYLSLRWIVSLAALSILIPCFNTGRKSWAWIFLILLIAFNPISKINFGREFWRVIDGATGAAFAAFVVALKPKNPKSEQDAP
jgi:hypothetical protein